MSPGETDPTEKLKKAVLVVDDDQTTLNLYELFLERYYQVHKALNGREACLIVRNQDIDCLITDIDMPVMNGMELLEMVNESHPNIKTIVVTGRDRVDIKAYCKGIGVCGYYVKPLNMQEIVEQIDSLMT